MSLQVAIIGCGLIGSKRAAALDDRHVLTAVADIDPARAAQLASRHPGCKPFTDWREAIGENVQVVIVSTTNDMLAPVSLAAIQAGLHVLVEKPAARNATELRPLFETQRMSGSIVKVGFNLRFHPAFQRARQIIDQGHLGPLMFLRARYGHGGRLGMEKEWRGNPTIAGGGEMLDQGVHLIDLAQWFLGSFSDVTGHVARFFWNWQVEDNGFALLKTSAGQVAWLHASCTEWKNLFSFEIYGQTGKLQIDGLGGSYGPEKLAHYRMLPQMGPPEVTIEEFSTQDTSWRAEFDHFTDCVLNKTEPLSSLDETIEVLRIVDQLYAAETARSGKPFASASLHIP